MIMLQYMNNIKENPQKKKIKIVFQKVKIKVIILARTPISANSLAGTYVVQQ